MPDAERVAEILGAWQDARDRGELLDPTEVVRRHPDLADELRAHFAILGVIDQAFEPRTEPTAIGPYKVAREIGSGGMGTVYLAESGDGSECVAVKVLHSHLLARPGFFKRFLREAEAGKRVEHQNVVRTLDVDAALVDGVQANYLVMEYVEGRTLRRLLTDLGTVPEALLREIAKQVATGLEAIHAAGIVHRDLKPENVLITDDHRVRIMDLGVARLVEGTAALTQEGQFAGSLFYAAPEQFGEGEVGPRSDLYALGVLLYELATGENPFRGDEAAAVMRAHLEEVPVRASERNTEVSTFLGEVIATLLAKDPSSRVESASALREIFELGERSPWWAERERTLLAVRLPKVPVRRETALHGRETDLALLRDAWNKAREGQGNTILVEGEAGIGKSRLVDAFLSEFEGDGVDVLYGSYPPLGGLGGLSEAVVEHFGAAGLEEALAPYLTVTPRLVPAFASLVKHEAPPEGSEPLQGDALHAVFVHLMQGLAADKPLVWVVEDLHFAESDSRKVALSLARAVEGHRVLLLLTTRPGIPEEEAAHFSRLENLRRTGLGRLSAREVILLLRDAFRSEMLAEKLGGKVALKSDGVPFFVFEVIRGLKEGQFITELPDGSWVESKVIDEIEVPSAVKDLIEARLRDLSDEERAILDVGAVQGFEFDADLVTAARRMERLFVLERLAAVERRSGVVRVAGPRYRFDHHQIQEVLYSQLSPGLKQEYHALLASALAEREQVAGRDPADTPGDTVHLLAWHHLRSRDPHAALALLKPALDHLEKSYRNEAAIELADIALRVPGLLEGRERVETLEKKGRVHELRGEREGQRASLEQALELADASGDAVLRARVRSSLGWHSTWVYDLPKAKSYAEQALALAPEAGDKETEARATMNLATVFWRQGHNEEARAYYERSLVLAREAGDKVAEMGATGNLGGVHFGQGRHEEARAHIEKQLALSREIGRRDAEAKATGNLGLVLSHQGRHEEARVLLDRQLAMAREIGARASMALATGNLGGVLWNQGRHEEARAHFEKSLALSRETGDLSGVAYGTGNLGDIFGAQGRYEEAREQHEKHVALAHEIGDRRSEALALANLGCVLYRQGRSEEARARLEECLALAREIGEPSREGYALAGLASIAEATGQAKAARRLYGQALATCRALGARGRVAIALVGLGCTELELGDQESAVEHLEEARTLAQEVKEPGTILLAAVHRARLPGGDKDAASGALREHEGRVGHGTKMEARLRLWELTKDEAHLKEAHRLLSLALDHTPEQLRESMVDNVPLHRDIMRAWEEHGRDA